MLIGTVNELLPVLNFASRDAADAGCCWGPRVIPDFQLFYVLSGEAELRLGPITYQISSGECVFYGKDSPHQLRTLTWTDYYSIHFAWNGLSAIPVHPAYGIRELAGNELQRKAVPYEVDCPGYGAVAVPHHFPIAGVESIMMRLVKEYRQEQPGFAFLARALLIELLTAILRQAMVRDKGSPPSKIDAALHAIREHPAKAWSVAEIAELCGYHPSYFTSIFYREMGQKPKQFLISERIKLAKQGLLSGEPIEALAERLGYAGIHYFSNNFKKVTGVSPSQFRQRPDRK